MERAFIAIDWGTTNCRAYRIEGGRVAAAERNVAGVSRMAPGAFPGAVAAIRASLGDLPVLMAGMVGSTVGWRAVPYVAAPAAIADLARAVHRIDPRTAIVPGVSCRSGSRGDVMRGEEVQLLGAALAGQVPDDASLCQPGTHCKWVDLVGGRIAHFTTTMTGELFALLQRDGILAPQLRAAVTPGDAFLEGVREGARRDLLASLFGIRANSVLGLRDDAQAASFASGVLIGNDVAPRIDGQRPVDLVADGALAALYAAAIGELGGTVRTTPCETAFVAGMTRIQELAE